MKKETLLTLILIVIFVLFVSLTTLFTLLDAFVFDRPIEEGTIIRDPSATIFPTNTRPATKDTAAPDSSEGSSSEKDPSSGNSSADDGTHTTLGTAEKGDDPAIPDSSQAPNTTDTPTVTTEAPPPVEYPILEDRYYKDENIEISIEEDYYLNQNGVSTRYFVVDIKLSDIEYLRTYYKTDWRGNVVKDTTSNLAEDVNAIFAVNGDFFSFRKKGFVLRNYELIRTSARSKDDDDALIIMDDGDFIMIDENSINASTLPLSVYQCFSFGPRLVEYGEIVVDEDSEVGQHAESNPRTAIGIVEPLHYKIVVSEGRLAENDGLTLLELAHLMNSLGCDSAYNLDGGSSTTLYFNGEVINTPGRDDGSERSISDIIYINGLSHIEEE